jgi:hypothetical protein
MGNFSKGDDVGCWCCFPPFVENATIRNIRNIMEEAIQNLLRQAVRALCGGSDSNDDQLKEEIANISTTGK